MSWRTKATSGLPIWAWNGLEPRCKDIILQRVAGYMRATEGIHNVPAFQPKCQPKHQPKHQPRLRPRLQPRCRPRYQPRLQPKHNQHHRQHFLRGRVPHVIKCHVGTAKRAALVAVVLQIIPSTSLARQAGVGATITMMVKYRHFADLQVIAEAPRP